MNCNPKQIKLCGKEECNICFMRSFANYKGKTPNGKLKMDCWSSDNEVSPRDVMKKSDSKKYKFNCDRCNHNFETVLYNITNGNWCPYCSIPCKKLCNSENCNFCFNNSFASYDGKTPNGKLKVDCWNNENSISPRNVSKCNGNKFKFNCDRCNHNFETVLSSITNGNWCPYCSKPCRRLCEDDNCDFCFNNSFASYDGKTPNGKLKVDCWISDNQVSPRNVSKNSNTKFKFNCDSCNHGFETALSHIVNGKWCPYCANKKLCNSENCDFCFNNSFASYDGKTPNGKKKVDCWISDNKVSPRNVSKCNGNKFKFNCDSCNHCFETALSHIINGKWCPYCCHNPKLCEDDNCDFCFNNSFASYTGKTPNGKLKVDCWSNENETSPKKIIKCSHTKFKFNCDSCYHGFETALNGILSGRWCPYCANKKLCNSENCDFCFNNSFASYDGKTPNGKKKVDCWSSDNEVTPRNISKCNGNKFKFNCDSCHHSFNTALSDITNGNWCPLCKNKTEKKFLNWLKKNYTEYKIKHQPKYNWCKSPDTNRYLPFDFVIEELKLIIEVDGRQHFEQVSNWNSPEDTFEYDEYKMKQSLKNGYSIIRIFQEDIYNDINNWETKTKEVIKQYDIPKIICIGCNIKYKKYDNINNTMETIETTQIPIDKPHKCEKCNISFKFKCQLEKHCRTILHLTGKKKTRSDKKEPFKCPHCNTYTNKQQTNLKLHIINHHSDINNEISS